MCFTNAELRKAVELRTEGQSTISALQNAMQAEGINHDLAPSGQDPDPNLTEAELAFLRGETDTIVVSEADVAEVVEERDGALPAVTG